jgi:hypothetical protein
MIDEHSHCYMQKSSKNDFVYPLQQGGSLLQTLSKKLLNSMAHKSSQKAGEFLGEMATEGLIKKLWPLVKKSKQPAVDNAFVNELVAY